MKKLLSVILFLICALHIYGQVIKQPLENNPEQAEDYHKRSRSRIQAISDTISIPFFDDFTSSSVIPDPSRWMQNGGTFVNNNYPIDPPNYNVVTFDGLNAMGVPYITTNVNGPTDSLTSKPIDLSFLQNGDSIYLRFYWQAAGHGERPDPTTDSIRLQIKNRSGIWKTVWKQADDSSVFNYKLIRIGDSTQYYFKGFQFRYQSYGRLSGSYDVWNIDYIYLDTGALAKDNWSPDISFSDPPTSILKNYTAMPLQQYLPKINSETADSISVKIKSLTNKVRVFNAAGYLNDIKNNVFIDSILFFNPSLNPFSTDNFSWTIDKSKIPSTNVAKTFKYKFALKKLSGDPQIGGKYDYFVFNDQLGISDVDFTANDSVSRSTDITDYYSYDDGSAEFGYGVNQIGGKIAIKFKLNSLPDTLTQIKICFPKIGADRTGEPITLRVWKNVVDGAIGGEVVLFSQTVALNHPSAIDNFYTYILPPLKITDSIIYIGYQQSTTLTLFTGFDVNTNSNDKIFFNVNNTWTALTNPIYYDEGSLMIRPVFGNVLISGIEKQNTSVLDCDIYPNPAKELLFISGKVKNATLYDLAGRLILEKEFDVYSQDKSIDVSSLSNGFYILHLENGEAKTVKKIIVGH